MLSLFHDAGQKGERAVIQFITIGCIYYNTGNTKKINEKHLATISKTN